MKKKLLGFVSLLLLGVLMFSFSVSSIFAHASAATSAEGMIVIERDSTRVLYKKNSEKKLPMASTTKIVTAITVIENLDNLDKKVKVPPQAAGVEGSSIYLAANETVTIRGLLYGLMLQSGNDCAAALAILTADSIDNFAILMNETAKKAGANNSNFKNPHGLHHKDHYTTALDLALISAYAMENETFREIVSTKRYTMPWEGRDYDRVIINKNKILSTFDGGDGIKTGYTKAAGRCLVSSATRNGMNVIAVVLNCGPMFDDCRTLMETAFDNYKLYDLNDERISIATNVIKGKESLVNLGLKEHPQYPLTENEYKRLVYEQIDVKTMSAPVRLGQENGLIKIYLDNRLIFESKLYTISTVDSLSITDYLRDIIEEWAE